MADGPKLLSFPAPETITARGALQKALDDKEPLTNVLILSQREDGSIYHMESDGLTLSELNWILDSYKWWLMSKTSGDAE